MQILLEGVRKVFEGRGRPVVALDHVDLTIDSGEFVSILGPSGCGKSTMLQMIAGLEPFDGGEIKFNGERRTKGPLSAMVWQGYALFPWRTVIDNIAFALEMAGVSKAERTARAQELVKIMGLEGFEHHFPSELSGGMRQRVALARALCSDPEILLMDEPLAALDAQTRLLMQAELLRVWEAFRKTVVYVTHSIEEAVFLGDRVAIMTSRPGRIKEIVPISIPRPRNLDTMRTPEFRELCDACWGILKEELPVTI